MNTRLLPLGPLLGICPLLQCYWSDLKICHCRTGGYFFTHYINTYNQGTLDPLPDSGDACVAYTKIVVKRPHSSKNKGALAIFGPPRPDKDMPTPCPYSNFIDNTWGHILVWPWRPKYGRQYKSC